MATYRRRLPATSSTIPTRVLLTCSTTLIGASAWLILDDRPRPAGLAAALAGVAGIAGGRFAVWNGDGLSRLFDPIVDRAFDGLILGSIAWVERASRPGVAAAGLAFGWLGWTLWAVAALAGLASLIRTIQVAKEELV